MTASRPDGELAKRSVASLAYDRISERITSGEFAANERLTEADLVKDLGVSRGAIREAMSKLAADGLIEIELNKGAIVRAISRKDMADFLEVRALHESFAARRAAERSNEPGSRERIHDVIEECSALIENPTPEGLVELDSSFKTTLMELSGNNLMASDWRRLSRSRYRISYILARSPEEIVESAERDRETLFAILDGDPELASAAAARHVRLTNSRIQRLTNEQFDTLFNSARKRKPGAERAAPARTRKTAKAD